MFTVFVSHSSVDREFVESEIVPLLRDDGLQPWYSHESIQIAEDWEKSIFAGLRSSDWVSVILSPESASSEWVKREVDWAMNERRDRVIPILYRSCHVANLHPELPAIQCVDFRHDILKARMKLSALWDDFMIMPRAVGFPPQPNHASRDKRSRVFFNNGWDGFSIDTDKNVLFYLSLAASTRLVRHIEFMRQYKAEVYDATVQGLSVQPRLVAYPYEPDACLSICFGSSLRGWQSETSYYRFFKTYSPSVPKAVTIHKADGNEEAMWVWSAMVPRSWLQDEPPFVTPAGKSQMREVVEAWVTVHNAEIEKIKQA